MYNVLVAEDEQAERDSLVQLLDEEFAGVLDVRYTAANGLFALKYLLSHPIDILFLDIRMPVMTGIDLMREVRRVNSEVEIIVVSAYSDFEYAQQSLSFGAADYLLKPYTTTKLRQAVAKALDRLERRVKGEQTLKILEEQRERLREMINRDVISSIFYSKSPPSRDEFDQLVILLDLPSRQWTLAIFRFAESDSAPGQEEWAEFLRMYRSQRRESIVHGAGRELIALNFQNPGEPASRNRAFFEFCRRYCELELQRSIRYTVSGEHSGPEGLLEAYNEGLSQFQSAEPAAASMGITFLGAEFARETAGILIGGDRRELATLLKRLIPQIEELNRPQRAGLLRNYLTLLQGELFRRLPRRAASRGDLLISGIKEELVNGDKTELHRCVSGMNRLMDELTRMLGGSREVMVSRVQEFIWSHMDEDLSIERLSGTENISPSHLSRIFKEVTGTTVNQFITSTRLERGDELLRTEGLTVKEIAPRIGIRDPNYFTKIYKKYFGRTPTSKGN